MTRPLTIACIALIFAATSALPASAQPEATGKSKVEEAIDNAMKGTKDTTDMDKSTKKYKKSKKKKSSKASKKETGKGVVRKEAVQVEKRISKSQ